MGLNPLKEKQLEAMMAFLGGRDTFVSLPTGYMESPLYMQFFHSSLTKLEVGLLSPIW